MYDCDAGSLLQEIAAKAEFSLPTSGAQGVAVEGGLAEQTFNHIAGVSVCEAVDSPAAKCINVTIGSKPGPGSIKKALVWCADGAERACVGTNKSKTQLAGWQGQTNLRGSMVSPLQPATSRSDRNPCTRAQRNPSKFRLLLTSSRAVLADDQCEEISVEDERIGDMLKQGFRVRLLISGVVAGAEFVKFNYLRVRQGTKSEVVAAQASAPEGTHPKPDPKADAISDPPAHFPPGSTSLAPFYLSEHDILLRQVRGVAHATTNELKQTATFKPHFESKTSYGSRSQYHWHPAQGPGAPGVSGFWGELSSRSFHLWYPNSGFTEVIQRNMLLQPELGRNLTEELLRTGWVDRRTRAIFVEFSLNTFDTRQAFPHLVRIVAEFSPYGHVELEVDVQVKTLDLLLDGQYGEGAIMQISTTVIFSLALLSLQSIVVFVSETMEMRLLGFEYLENMWNVIDVGSVLLLVWSMVDFAAFLDILLGFLATVQGKDSSVPTAACMVPGARSCELFASHQLSATLEKFVLSFSFFTSLHVFKFLKYATLVPALDIPFQAMLKVAGRVAALTFTVFVCLTAFAIMFTGFAGPHMNQFSEIHLSLLQMLALVTSFDTNAMVELVDERPLTGSLLRSMASFLMVIIMLTVFIAVLVEGYSLAVQADEEVGDIHHMYYNLIKEKVANMRLTAVQHLPRVFKATPHDTKSKSSSPSRGKNRKAQASVPSPAEGDTIPPSSLTDNEEGEEEDDILAMANALFHDASGGQKAPSQGNGSLFRRKHTRIADASGSSSSHTQSHTQGLAHFTPHREGHASGALHSRKQPRRKTSTKHASGGDCVREGGVAEGVAVAGVAGTRGSTVLAQTSRSIEAKMPTMWGRAAIAAALARKAAHVKTGGRAQRDSDAVNHVSRISQVHRISTLEDRVSDLQASLQNIFGFVRRLHHDMRRSYASARR